MIERMLCEDMALDVATVELAKKLSKFVTPVMSHFFGESPMEGAPAPNNDPKSVFALVKGPQFDKSWEKDEGPLSMER
jgi:hypothetical protein